jgi:hypothetical protein
MPPARPPEASTLQGGQVRAGNHSIAGHSLTGHSLVVFCQTPGERVPCAAGAWYRWNGRPALTCRPRQAASRSRGRSRCCRSRPPPGACRPSRPNPTRPCSRRCHRGPGPSRPRVHRVKFNHAPCTVYRVPCAVYHVHALAKKCSPHLFEGCEVQRCERESSPPCHGLNIRNVAL